MYVPLTLESIFFFFNKMYQFINPPSKFTDQNKKQKPLWVMLTGQEHTRDNDGERERSRGEEALADLKI